MCDERVWQPQCDHFASSSDIICADITRHRSMAAIGGALLEEISWDSFIVVGLSMGGIVAMELLRQAPDRITHCALLDTNHKAELPERQSRRHQEIARAEKGELRQLIIEEMKPAYLSPSHSYNRDFLQLVVDMAMELGTEVFINQSLALRDRPDYSEVLRQANCPMLLLCGEEDSLCPVSRHKEIQQLTKQAHLYVIKGAGHLANLEKPTEVNEKLARWLHQSSR